MSTADFTHATWRKSSRSVGQNDQCVEMAAVAGLIGIRDSKHPDGPVLVIAPAVWTALRTGL